MQRTLVMLVLALRGCGRTIRMGQAEFKSRRSRSRRDLRNDGASQHGVENERIGGDPADQLAPKSEPPWSLRRHSHALPRTVASSRIGQDTVQRIIA